MATEREPPLMAPTLDELAAEGGWTIEDPQARRDRNPDTFWLPDDDLRASIRPGSQVRMLVWFIDEDGPDQLVPQCERVWALVETREGEVIRGRLALTPLSARAALEMGELIQFRPTDAIDALDPEADWHEHRDFLQAVFEGDDAFEEWKRRHPYKLDPRA